MYYKEINPGCRIELTLAEENQDAVYYTAKIISIYENEKIFIMEKPCVQYRKQDNPIASAEQDMLSTQASYHVIFLTPDIVLASTCTIVSYNEEDEKAYVAARLLSEVAPAQRRHYTRHACNLPLSYSIADNSNDFNNEDLSDLQYTQQGIVCDISEGGLKFISNTPIQPDDVLFLKIEKDKSFIRAVGIVINQESKSFEDGVSYESHLKFIKVENNRRSLSLSMFIVVALLISEKSSR